MIDISLTGNFLIISHIYRLRIIEIYYIIFKFSMEQLNSLIKDASNEFECHNFQTSLSLYVRCIERCVKEKLPKYILNNLKSSQAALRTILGDYDTALSILNSVLAEDPHHWLCLIRRSQVYKKQNKFKKAMKDLDILSMYAPDNMQVAALKLEVKGFMSHTNGSTSSESESQSQIQKIDEEEVLKFQNLRKIDRTSVSIMLPKGRQSRQSRVTISGDQSFFYEATNDNKQSIRASKTFTPSFNCQRFIQIDKELEQTNESEQNDAPVILIKSKPTRTKSILKNRNSTIYRSDNLPASAKEEQKKLISKVQNIDGHIIGHQIASNKSCSQKEVEFKKSLFADEPPTIIEKNQDIIIKKKKGGARKSCLKRSSFSTNNEEQEKKQKGPRRSKFETMSRNSIDGKIIKSDKKKKEAENEASKENMRQQSLNNQSDSQSEEGSQYNIFGSKKIILNKELRQNLGLGSDSIVGDSESSQKMPKKKQRGQSILKTTSIIVKKDIPKKKASIFSKGSQKEEENEALKERKNKKSVMFISC